MKSRINKLVLSGVLLIAVIATLAATLNSDIYLQISRNIDLFGKIYKEITFNYVEDVDPEEFMKAGIEGMLNSLDPYTVYYDADNRDEIDLLTSGKYGGVGITIGIRGERVIIVEVMEGYAAQKQGIKPGDVLFQAGGVYITPKNVDEVSKLVKGTPGSSVEMRIIRNEDKDTLKFDLIREEVVIKNIAYANFYPSNSNNVYIKLAGFNRTAAEELRNTLKKLKTQKPVESVILDLRGNPGGLLDIAVDICNNFLKKDQLVVSTKGRTDESERKYYALQEPVLPEAKLVVLVNEGSASASEIVAGAVQDHDRGIILGNRTFGKGLVQTIIPIPNNASIKITTAKYYTPSGRCIQKINYSLNSKSISNKTVDSLKPYYTDVNRIVFGSGGIMPDTVISEPQKGKLTKELLAKGLIYKFADYYYSNNEKKEFDKIGNDELFKSFESFIIREKFQYVSDAAKEIDEVLADIKQKDSKGIILSDLEAAKKLLEKISNQEVLIYKNEILKEIKSELAIKYSGTAGKVEYLLKEDLQFQNGLKIINNDKLYKHILRIN